MVANTEHSPQLTAIYPLDGVVVVDISRLAITFVSRLLTDMGATTIAVHPPANTAERLTTPYAGARAASPPPIPGPSIDKLNLSLDLKNDAGRAELYELVKRADIFIEGYRPGVAARLGCDYETIRALNPDIVYASVTGYGQTGPRASAPGHDLNYVSIGGAQSLVRTPEGEYATALNIIADMAGCGMYGAMTICAALAHRNAGGGGTYLDVSMTDGVATLIGGILNNAATQSAEDYAWPRNPRNPMGGRGMLGGGAPFYRIYHCSDGLPLSVGCIEPQFWAALCRVTGLEEWLPYHLDEERWDEMVDAFTAVFATATRDEWLQRFEGADTCVTPVLTPAEARDDEQLAHRRIDGVYGAGRVQTPRTAASRAQPAAVLRSKGYPDAVIERLSASA